jgi:hypothetical protein
MKCGLGVFKKNTIIDDDLPIKRYSQILTQMNGVVYFSATICGSKSKRSRQSRDFYSM